MSEKRKQKNVALQINKKTLISITALLLGIMIFAGVLTQIIPTGIYNVRDDGSIIDGTYHLISKEEAGYSFWRVFIAPIECFIYSTSDALTGLAIIIFIIVIGGTFLILDNSGVLKYIMSTIVRKYSSKKYMLLAVMIFACMALSSLAGILEESVTLVPLAVAISLSLGWDSLVGLGFSLIAVAFGYTAATFNPFNIGIVQSMANLPMFSGLTFRLLVFAVVYVILAAFLITYAKKIENNPKKSIVYDIDLGLKERFINADETEKALKNPNLGKATRAFISSIAGVLVITIGCFIAQRFIHDDTIANIIGYLPMVSMAILFAVGGLRAGSIAGIKGKELGKGFFDGAMAVMPCAPLIIFIISITYILKQGKIIHTMLYHIYNFIQDFSPEASMLMIFALIIVFEFFIGSGTAKAFLLMPLLIPLIDMIGIERQSLVLAFCLSDGFCNILFPTSGIMIIAIGILNIPYSKYMKFTWKLFFFEFAAAVGLILLALAIGYH